MNQQISQNKIIIYPEQFQQIVNAIHSGKYSLASLIILRSAGYNPLRYIPYRTYKRLMKGNYELHSAEMNQ